MVIGQIRITKNGLQGFNLDKTITHFTNAGKKSSNFRVFLLVFSILLNEHGKFNGPFLRVSLKSANFFFDLAKPRRMDDLSILLLPTKVLR